MSLPSSESLTVEFKSDRHGLPDRELVEAVVCMANAQGGDLYLGVEDDGRATGLHPRHQNLDGLAALVANRTMPSVHVQVEAITVAGMLVARIQVPAMAQPIAITANVAPSIYE
jgi:ATP-dependent DNA helicase RecG